MLKYLKHTLVAAFAAAMLVAPATAKDWAPDGPVKILVGFGAGGSTDALSRAIGKAMEENTGWDVVVENAPGGGGIAMLSRMQALKPDGRTLGVGVSIPVWINLKRRGDQLPFKLESFDWMATIGRAGLALTFAADHPANNFEELVAIAKKDGVTVATAGPAQEMIIRALASATKAEFIVVPVKSAGEMIQNILGGHVHAATLGGAHVEYVKSGKMKILAGLTPVRDAADLEVKTLMELGYPFAIDASFFIAAPAGLSKEAHDAIAKAIDQALLSPSAITVIENMSMKAQNLGPDGTTEMMNAGLASIGEILAAAGK